MKPSQIALFLAAIAIEACVGDVPGSSERSDGDGGTGSSSGDGNAAGTDADGGSGGGRDAGEGARDASAGPGSDGGFGAGDAGGLVIGCHNASDCPGQVCCGRKEDNDTSVYKSVSCEATCDGAYVYDHSTFCDPNDPHSCDGVVVNPHCEPSDILSGLFVCVSN